MNELPKNKMPRIRDKTHSITKNTQPEFFYDTLFGQATGNKAKSSSIIV